MPAFQLLNSVDQLLLRDRFVNMNVKKASRLSWFTTQSGRRFSLACLVTAGVGAAAVNLLPHTLFLDKYRELFQMYRKSTPVRVPLKIKKQFKDVLDDLKVPQSIQVRLKPFVVNGFDVFHAGTTYMSSGAVVGVPINFINEEVKNIDQSTLLVQSRHVDWSQPDGQNLLSALMLSDDAKKFAIGREIVRSQTMEPLLNSIYPITCTATAYIIGSKCNSILNGLTRPLSFRIILYVLTGLFNLGNWFLLKDVTTVHYDTECDKEMSNLGKDYIKGGQEFYNKILQRNVALRNLMGAEGAKLYSATGNDQFLIRHKRVPIIHRKLYFDEQMESLNSQEVA